MSDQSSVQIEWDIGTGYDMFVSLWVLHEPDRFGLRGSWAAGVRSRLPAAERDLLQRFIDTGWPVSWPYTLNAPKDGNTVIKALEAIPPADRLEALYSPADPKIVSVLHDVGMRGTVTDENLAAVVDYMQHDADKKMSTAKATKKAEAMLQLWANPVETGEGLLSGLCSYQEQFFAEEEVRIAPALLEAQTRAQEMAEKVELPELLEELSQGVRVDKKLDMKRAILVPSFWSTPFMVFAMVDKDTEMFLYGARPNDASLIPGEVVPDALYQALKALADPTRLRILRYLEEEPATASQLAKRLRLRAPTVIHHLDALRLARMVQLTLSHESKRYAIRKDAVTNTCAMLEGFLSGEDNIVADYQEES